MPRIKAASIFAVVAGMLVASVTATSVADEEVIVATDDTGDWADDPDLGGAGTPIGLDVTELAIRTDEDEGAVEFIIRLAELNAPPPHEIVRYLWQMHVDQQEYWIQAKMSDATGGTTFADDPEGALTNVDGAFRLRGDCQVVGIIATCVHLMWIEGVFDVDANEVRMRVPLGTEIAPHFAPGKVISPTGEGSEMTASIQVLISNAATSDNVTVLDSYTIPA